MILPLVSRTFILVLWSCARPFHAPLHSVIVVVRLTFVSCFFAAVVIKVVGMTIQMRYRLKSYK